MAAEPLANSRESKWALVATSGALTGIGHGFVSFAVSALLKPVAADLELGRTVVSAAVGMGRLVGGIAAPIVGQAVDRLSPRWVVATGMVITAIGLAATGMVSNQWWLYVAWSVMVSGGVATAFTVALDKIVVMKVRQGRGLALAVRFSVAGAITTALLPLAGWAIEAIGWRQTCFAWSALVLALVPVPLLMFPAKQTPIVGMRSALPIVVAVPEERAANSLGFSSSDGLRPAFRSAAYWLVALAFALQAAVNTGMVVHVVPLMTDGGMRPSVAAALVGGLVLMSIPVRLATGHFVDRLSTPKLPVLLGVVIIAEAVAIGSQAIWPSPTSLALLLAALGVSTGAPTLIVLVLVARIFGERNFGAIQGSLMLLHVPGTTMAPVLAGYVFDSTGSYAGAIAVFAAMLLFGAACLFGVRVPHS